MMHPMKTDICDKTIRDTKSHHGPIPKLLMIRSFEFELGLVLVIRVVAVVAAVASSRGDGASRSG